jgi:KRAB domain-containing zinc finger protein
MNETTFSFIKEETVDFETVMLNQGPLGNSMDCIRSNCNLDINRSPTIVNDIKEVFSGSIYLDFECKDDPLSVDFDGGNKESTTYNEATNHNPNLDTILDCKIESVKENVNSMHDDSKDFISVQYPLNVKKEFTEQYPQQLSVKNQVRNRKIRKITKLNCPYCAYKGSTWHEKIHVMAVHDQIKPFECKFCDYSANYSSSFKIHTATIHKNLQLHAEMLHSCPYCEHKCRSSHKNSHIMTVHDQIRPFKCKFCEHSATNLYQLKIHNITKHKCKDLQLQGQLIQNCPNCGFKGRAQDKDRHIMAVHDQIRPFQCKFCEYCTTRLQYLKRHNSKTHIQMQVSVNAQQASNNGLPKILHYS